MAKRLAVSSGGCWPPASALQPPWWLGPAGVRFAPQEAGHLDYAHCKGSGKPPVTIVKVHSKGAHLTW